VPFHPRPSAHAFVRTCLLARLRYYRLVFLTTVGHDVIEGGPMNPLIPTPADVALIIAFLVPIAAAIWAFGLQLSIRRRRRELERRADMTSVRPRRR
jgi:Zn-dependent protease with chaperone function